MATSEFSHHHAELNGIDVHYVTAGAGAPLVLLHGWPEFWRIWERMAPRLADAHALAMPDLRGFGESAKPPGHATETYRLEDHVADVAALVDHLGLERFGLVSHDVGAVVAQAFARAHPERLAGLFFFDCPYPGIGARWASADSIPEIWYQGFQQQHFAAELVGQSRDLCRAYFRHFLEHWAGRPGTFDEVLEDWVDNFMAPGNLQGGFNWYLAARSARLAAIRGDAPAVEPIAIPTRVLWGERDPVLKVAWMDRLGETFTDLEASVFEGVGHFAAFEAPEAAADAVRAFFARLGHAR